MPIDFAKIMINTTITNLFTNYFLIVWKDFWEGLVSVIVI
jgi:hypothetical protein